MSSHMCVYVLCMDIYSSITYVYVIHEWQDVFAVVHFDPPVMPTKCTCTYMYTYTTTYTYTMYTTIIYSI